MSKINGNRRLHDARQVKIKKARRLAMTRLLSDKEAHEQLRQSAREQGRKTLIAREAVTEEDIERWEAEQDEEITSRADA